MYAGPRVGHDPISAQESRSLRKLLREAPNARRAELQGIAVKTAGIFASIGARLDDHAPTYSMQELSSLGCAPRDHFSLARELLVRVLACFVNLSNCLVACVVHTSATSDGALFRNFAREVERRNSVRPVPFLLV
jgi:hypothetical protein